MVVVSNQNVFYLDSELKNMIKIESKDIYPFSTIDTPENLYFFNKGLSYRF
jgi:hypothetical protein